ncbi:MAG: EAL domain-containing protein [Zoogloeaceae bacterium]|nr:EAL domain-containing protein [Zoogloeaceae bacterium]
MTFSTDDTHILIVDDDPLTRTLAGEALRESGYAVSEAEDGPAGLQAFETLRPDLVLLDVLMPGLDGFSVCRRLRAHPRRGHVPVIMMTGLEDTESIEEAYESGATDFISKPINWALLKYRIGYVMRAASVLDELRRSERILSTAQEIAHMGSWEWSLEKGAMSYSRSFYQIFGEDPLTFGEGVAAVLSRVYPPDRPMVEEGLAGTRKGRGYRLEYRIVRPDGFVRTVSEMTIVIRDSKGDPIVVQGTLQDVTERVEAEKRIRYLAYFDDLTGLPNRACFAEMVHGAVLRAGRRSGRCAVVLLDVERFGRVNQTLGADAGDQALQLISARLRDFQRTVFDTYSCAKGDPEMPRLARLGSDEFAMMVEDAPDPPELEAQVYRLLATFSRPFKVGGEELSLSARAGLAISPDHAGDSDALLKAADTALAEVRRGSFGGAQVVVFSESMRLAAFERIGLEGALRRAIGTDEMSLHFQPKIDLRSRHIVGAEALLRWNRPGRGPVSPGEFIPLAEETGLIAPLSDWVLEAALAAIARWTAAGVPAVPVSINLCAAQFRSGRLVDEVRNALDRHHVEAHRLEIEVTESVLMHDLELATRIFAELSALGVRTAIDDFGTGYSSLAYLQRFHLDSLKIDRSFVSDLGLRNGADAIVGAIIALAKNLNIGVVAEGVDEPGQARVLQDRGCHLIQGHLFSPPVAEAEFVQMLESRQPLDSDFLTAFDPAI